MILASACAAILEGVGLASILPLLEKLTATDGAASSVSTLSTQVFALIGVKESIGALLVLVVVAFTLKGVVSFYAMKKVGFIVAAVGHDLRLSLMKALLSAKLEHFSRQSSGAVANSISSEAHRASWGYLSICSGIAELIQILVYWFVLLLISWKAAMLLPIAGGLILLCFNRFIFQSRSAGNASTEHLALLVNRISELLPGLKPIKAMGLERQSWFLLTREAELFQTSQKDAVTAKEVARTSFEPIVIALLAIALYSALNYRLYSFPELLLLAVLFQRLVTRVTLFQGTSRVC